LLTPALRGRFVVPDTTLSYPDGLAYRLDLPDHLAGPDGFTNSGQLSGTHNLDNATAALDAQGAAYTLTPTSTDLQYQSERRKLPNLYQL